MSDPLSAKLGEFDISNSGNMNGNIEADKSSNENIYVPTVTKDILQ